jgi:acylglycerol lipase
MIRSPAAAGRLAAPRRRWWRALPLVALLLLAACLPAADPRIRLASLAPPSIPSLGATARFTDAEFIATDGTRLPLRKWLPRGPVTAVVLALHGFGDYSRAFEMPAARWAAQGIATYAFDQRGFGGAPQPGVWAGEAWLAADAVAASRILRARYPGRPLYLLGESMGAAVAILAATGAIDEAAAGPRGAPVAAVDGVVLSAPAIWGRTTMEVLPRLALFAGVRLFPQTLLTGKGLRILASDNLPMLRELARDPLVLKGARIETIYGLVDLMDDAFAAAPLLDAPLLLLYGAHDEVIPRRPIAEFVARLPPDSDHRRRLAYYRKGYHMLLRDLEGAMVAGDVAGWIRDRTAPLSSRADAGETARPWPPEPEAAAGGAALPLAEAGTRR